MKKKITLFGVLCLSGLLLSACGSQQTRHRTTNVVEFLYPNAKKMEVVKPSIPILRLPIKVGVTFVPEQYPESRGGSPWSRSALSALTAADKAQLLEKVSANFRTLPFVSKIDVIPSEYLRPHGGFTNLQQIKNMYDVDVIALVSYDQMQFTDESLLSLSYWTIIGAYVIRGEKNDTSTMLDTVVYDIESQKMLFRAPGISNVKGSATPRDLQKKLREDSLEGFQKAADQMIVNLDVQLKLFQQRVKDNPTQAKIVHRPGYAGGGAMGLYSLGLVFSIFAFFAVFRRKLNQ